MSGTSSFVLCVQEYMDGRIFIIVTPLLIVAAFGAIIRHFTGGKILVLSYRSALIRFLAGIALSLFPVIWWGFELHRALQPTELCRTIVVNLLFACSLSAILLIPLSIVQFAVTFFRGIGKNMGTLGDPMLGKGMTASEAEDLCPRCQSNHLRKRHTHKSALSFAGLFIAWILLTWVSSHYGWDVLFGVSCISLPFIFGAVLVSGLSAAFGKSKCLDCKHSWQ